jgi:subfamily B ATP-binding cassette protein MsbA
MNRARLYFRMLGFIKPYVPLLALTVILSFCIVSFEATSLWISTTLITTLFNPNAAGIAVPGFSASNLNTTIKAAVYAVIQAPTPVGTLARVCIIFIVAYTLKNTFNFLNSLLVAFINLRVVRDMRNTLYAHVLKLPVTYYDRNRSGEIISRIINDVGQVNAAMTNTLSKLVTEPVRLLAFLTALIIIKWQMTVMVLLVYPVLGFIIVKIGQSVRRRSKRVMENLAGLMSVLHETVSGIRAVKMFNMNEAEAKKFRAENQRFIRNSFRSTRTREISSPLTETFGLALAVSLLWYGGSQVLAGKGMNAEDFIRYLTILLISYQPLKALAGINNQVQTGLAAAERFFAVLDAQTEKLVPFRADSAPAFEREISLTHVTFSYPGASETVLDDISFTVTKGSIVALIGSSGAGKSTVLDLLPRFYDVTRGVIAIDGRDIRECDLVGLRHLFGIVSQETILFNDTVAKNIAYGCDAATPALVTAAAKAANALEFIEKLPKGMETVIGEKGVLLSGGQCQRLAIARALLRNPPILILDEATSSLDTESERLVQTAINALITNRTAIVVAHRLSTIRNADRILVLDKGRIIEEGTHEELIARPDSRYKYFYDIQFSGPA